MPAKPGAAGHRGVTRQFMDAIRELNDGGWEGATEGLAATPAVASAPASDLAEVVLECVFSTGVDVGSMQLKHKCLALRAGEGPWTVGRLQQPNLFTRLVPDEGLRALISRSHMAFTWENRKLRMKKLSPNAMQLNSQPATQQEVEVGHGALIGLCGRDNVTAFLVFGVLLRDTAAVLAMGPTPVPTQPDMPAPWPPPQPQPPPASPRSQAPGQAQAPASQMSLAPWRFTGPPAPYLLVCVMAFGYDVLTALPPEARTVGVRSDSPLTVGRNHQPGLFEGLMGPEAAQRYLCCISRAHLELRPMPDDPQQGCFEVTNLSANPVSLPGRPTVKKCERGTIRLGDCIEFIGASADGSGAAIAYLKLRLERGDPRAVVETPAVTLLPRAAISPHTPEVVELQRASLASEEPPRAQSPAVAAAAPSPMPFWLILEGTAVREDVPRERRRLEGRPDGLTVGRAHQKELHSEAFARELREYMSRDHFRVERCPDGSCLLVALSSNPIWRLHAGKLTELSRGDPALPLVCGDAVVLFTGAEDCTPDGPGNLGSCRWIFRAAAVLDDGALEARKAAVAAREAAASPTPCRAADFRESAKEPATPPRRTAATYRPPSQVAPLQAPISAWQQEDERRSLIDLPLPHVNDKFAASGFSYS